MRKRGLAVLGVAIAFASMADAHHAPSGMAYDPWCCNGDGNTGDCAPIPSRDVRITREGYLIRLQPGDHPGVHVSHVFLQAFSAARISSDGRYHACLFPTEYQLRCFYAPPQGS